MTHSFPTRRSSDLKVVEDLADPLLRRARYLAGRAGPGAFRLGRHGGYSPLSICAAVELVRPGVKICSSLAREGPRMRREKAAAHDTPFPGCRRSKLIRREYGDRKSTRLNSSH